MDIRYLDRGVDEGKGSWVSVLENVGRSVLASTVSAQQNLTASLMQASPQDAGHMLVRSMATL